MNIDITNYLSTIKHISNNSHVQKNTMAFPKVLEGLQLSVKPKTAKSETSRLMDSMEASKYAKEDPLRAKEETKNEAFVDQSSELEVSEDKPPESMPQYEFSPIHPQSKLEYKSEPEHHKVM